MAYQTNIIDFKKGFNCGSNLLESYCRMISIELALESIQPLKSHNIVQKLQNISKSNSGSPAAASLNAQITALCHSFLKIHVESKAGTCSLPKHSYPHIRYTRYSPDWSSPTVAIKELENLNNIAKKIISTLNSIGYKI